MITRQLRLYNIHASFANPDTNTKMHQDFVILASDKQSALGMAYQRLPHYAARHKQYDATDPITFRIDDIGRPYGPMTCFKSEPLPDIPDSGKTKTSADPLLLPSVRQDNPDKRSIVRTQIRVLWGKLSILLAEAEDTNPDAPQKHYIARQMNSAEVLAEFDDITDRILSEWFDAVPNPPISEFMYNFLASEFPAPSLLSDDSVKYASSDQILFGDVPDTDKIDSVIRMKHPDKYKSRTELDNQIKKKIAVLKSRQINIDLHSQTITSSSDIRDIQRIVSDKQKQEDAQAAAKLFAPASNTQNSKTESPDTVKVGIPETESASQSDNTPLSDNSSVSSDSLQENPNDSDTSESELRDNAPEPADDSSDMPDDDTDHASDISVDSDESNAFNDSVLPDDEPDDYDDDDMDDGLYDTAEFGDEGGPVYDDSEETKEDPPEEDVAPPYEKNSG